MSQLFALVWLKWTLVRNSLRSRRAVAGRVAAALGVVAGLTLSCAAAFGVGVGAYFISAHAGRWDAQELSAAFAVLLFIFTTLFLMWALMPLALGGGNRFEPSRMLLYPVSLGRLFAFDFLSDLTGLTSVFVVPSLVALCVGVGLGRGNFWAGLAVAFVAVAFGLSFSKLLSVGVGALMRSRRTRGETALAIVGAVLALMGVLMGQLMPYIQRHADSLGATRWTPPGAAAHALARGLFAGDSGALAVSTLTLAAYAVVCTLLAYRVARRTALGVGGGKARRKAALSAETAPHAGRGKAYAGWQLPFVSQEFSALFEKEVRYAMRNAQLRVMAVMAMALTIVLRLGPAGAGSRRMWSGLTPYAEGAGAVFSVIYIFMLVSPISTNLFGYDGAGMRALVLSPVSRQTMLLAKNAAATLISLLLVAVGVGVGGFFLGDLTAPVLLFALLAFVTTAALFAPFGNWLSLQFPKRVQFGKRMNRSGVAGLMLVPIFFVLLLPPAAAVVAAHFAASYVVKYVILAAFALLCIGFYALILPRQGRTLERRELEVLEAVTGRGGGEDEQIIG
ncbi:MAG: type transport system permease protein [Acidobacteriota bacterium]|jgi:ABC-2 type transport system permease protein|nr:type transport system permease protein [Acidobacteriota bacterium]